VSEAPLSPDGISPRHCDRDGIFSIKLPFAVAFTISSSAIVLPGRSGRTVASSIWLPVISTAGSLRLRVDPEMDLSYRHPLRPMGPHIFLGHLHRSRRHLLAL